MAAEPTVTASWLPPRLQPWQRLRECSPSQLEASLLTATKQTQKQQRISFNASAHLRRLCSLPVEGLQQIASGQPCSQSHGKTTCRHMCMLFAQALHKD